MDLSLLRTLQRGWQANYATVDDPHRSERRSPRQGRFQTLVGLTRANCSASRTSIHDARMVQPSKGNNAREPTSAQMQRQPNIFPILLAVSGALVNFGCQERAPVNYGGPVAEWPHWGNSPGGMRFSSLTQITPENVSRLHLAWTYRFGGPPTGREALWFAEATPIVAEGRMYLCTPLNRVIALDPESGRELWSYDPHLNLQQVNVHFNCRGVTFHRDERARPGTVCAARIIAGTLDARLISLDAATGKPCREFGDEGAVDLTDGLGEVLPGDYNVTSPPVVAADRITLVQK